MITCVYISPYIHGVVNEIKGAFEITLSNSSDSCRVHGTILSRLWIKPSRQSWAGHQYALSHYCYLFLFATQLVWLGLVSKAPLRFVKLPTFFLQSKPCVWLGRRENCHGTTQMATQPVQGTLRNNILYLPRSWCLHADLTIGLKTTMSSVHIYIYVIRAYICR